jgi:hypothetical protein
MISILIEIKIALLTPYFMSLFIIGGLFDEKTLKEKKKMNIKLNIARNYKNKIRQSQKCNIMHGFSLLSFY